MSQKLAKLQLAMLEEDRAKEAPKKRKRKRADAEELEGAEVLNEGDKNKASWATVKSELDIEGRIKKIKKRRDGDKRLAENVKTLKSATAGDKIVRKHMQDSLELLKDM